MANLFVYSINSSFSSVVKYFSTALLLKLVNDALSKQIWDSLKEAKQEGLKSVKVKLKINRLSCFSKLILSETRCKKLLSNSWTVKYPERDLWEDKKFNPKGSFQKKKCIIFFKNVYFYMQQNKYDFRKFSIQRTYEPIFERMIWTVKREKNRHQYSLCPWNCETLVNIIM